MRYSSFSVGDEAHGYALTLGGFSSANLSASSSDGLGQARGRPFSTRDSGDCKNKTKVHIVLASKHEY